MTIKFEPSEINVIATAPSVGASVSPPIAREDLPEADVLVRITQSPVTSHSITLTPLVELTSGKVAEGITLGESVDISASDLVSGEKSITNNGTYDVTTFQSALVAVQNSGYPMETGTYTPSLDAARPQIRFATPRSVLPVFIMMIDSTANSNRVPANSNTFFALCNVGRQFNRGYPYNNGAATTVQSRYGVVVYGYTASTETGSSVMAYTQCSTQGGSNTTSVSYWCSNTGFYPYSASQSRFFRAGRRYSWLAVFKE